MTYPAQTYQILKVFPAEPGICFMMYVFCSADLTSLAREVVTYENFKPESVPSRRGEIFNIKS